MSTPTGAVVTTTASAFTAGDADLRQEDKIWPSRPVSEQIVARLEAKHFRFRAYLLEYDDAGRGLVGPRIGSGTRGYSHSGVWGGSNGGNNAARAKSLAREVASFNDVLKRSGTSERASGRLNTDGRALTWVHPC